ncbi:MAG: L-threonine 3-dehydrogenase [bacterium]|nr:L-threonine 3-dehydrogenase [bacterium]
MSTIASATMVGLKKSANETGLTYHTNIPIPTIGPHDALVEVTYAGICGTDKHIYDWDAWSQNRVKVGVTVGHEFVGRVVAVGDAVRRTSVGERVSAEGHISCGCCRLCRTGNAHICDSVEIIGIDRDGCFSQYVSVPEENIWPVHVDISDAAATLFDPLGNAMHTVMEAGVSGKNVLITGAGTIGLMAVSIARAAGASQIFAVDINQKRLDLAKKFGADVTFQANEFRWTEHLRDMTHSLGADVLLEMSGYATAIRQGFAALRNGGTAALLGLPAGDVSFDLANDIIFKGAKVLGINGRRMFETWYQVQDFILTGKLDVEELITHRLPMSDFEKGFEAMHNGEAIKVLLETTSQV